LNISALNARGLSKQTFFVETTKKGLILLSALITFKYGVVTMLWGNVIACFVSYLISVVYIKRDIQHYIRNQITDLISGLLIGVSIAALAFSLSFFIANYHILLFTQLILIVGTYIFAVKKVQPQLYNQVVGFIVGKVGMLKRKSS